MILITSLDAIAFPPQLLVRLYRVALAKSNWPSTD